MFPPGVVSDMIPGGGTTYIRDPAGSGRTGPTPALDGGRACQCQCQSAPQHFDIHKLIWISFLNVRRFLACPKISIQAFMLIDIQNMDIHLQFF